MGRRAIRRIPPLASGRRVRATLALTLAVASLVLPSASPRAAADGLEPVGKLDRVPADALARFGPKIKPTGFDSAPGTVGRSQDPHNALAGTILLVPEVRQLWQIFQAYDVASP